MTTTPSTSTTRRPGPTGFPGVVAPPTMLQAWIMRGYLSQPGGAWQAVPRTRSDEAVCPGTALRRPQRGGFTSVVATNCDQEYDRPIVLGDRLDGRPRSSTRSRTEKHTGLGDGPFRHHPASSSPTSTASASPPCCFRILRFRPEHAQAPKAEAPPLRPRARHHPGHRLLLRGCPAGPRCSSSAARRAACCATRPARPARRAGPSNGTPSTSTGRGTVYSYVVVHHPQVARASTTPCPSPWSSSRKGPVWWPT